MPSRDEIDSPPTGSAYAKHRHVFRTTGLFLLAVAISLLLSIFLQARTGSHEAELSGYPDEPSHYITGLMFRSYLHEGHFESPIRFTQNYYLHYPKVAIGHWPPVYYLVQCLWTFVFPATISSVLYLQAVLLGVTSAILFVIARTRFGIWSAIVLCVVFLILGPSQELGSEIMSEPLLALSTLAATWCIARYFESLRFGLLVGFVLLVEFAAHIKGSGIALTGLPVLVAACLRRWSIFRKPNFWLAQLGMILILVPWQVFTANMVRNGMSGPVTLSLICMQARDFGPITGKMFGWPLLILIIYGGCLAIASPKFRDPLLVSSAATLALTFAFHCVSPNGAEDRRLFMAVPGCLLLAPLPFLDWLHTRRSQLLTALFLLLIAAISLVSSMKPFHKTAVGYRPIADWLLSNDDDGEMAVFVASDIDGEGMLISEVAQHQPTPTLYIVRSSKLFEDCDWERQDCHPTITDPSQAEKALDSIPIRYAVIDRFSGIEPSTRTELLRHMIAMHSNLWVLRDTQAAVAPGSRNRGEVQVYERSGLNHSHTVHVIVDLHRMIGKEIGN
jgi:hypothetical protein